MFRVDPDRSRWFLREILPHEPALRAWLNAKRRVGIDVDDVIQETYTALAARETVDDIAHPRAYLFRIARSLVVRHVRRARIVSIQVMEDLDELQQGDDAPSPEQTLIDRDSLRHVADAISAMPGQARTAFVLRRVHGLSQREIASRMRVSENTVEKHIARGLRFLMDWFRDGGTSPPQASKTPKAQQDPAPTDGRTRNQPEHRRRRRNLGGAS